MTSLAIKETLPKNAIDSLQVVLASFFIGLCAQVEIPLYFTPVPLTIQTSAVMLTGAVLGSRKGVLTILLYLAQGIMGMPVFAGGGAGIIHIFGPTGGYLLAYILQAFVVGLLLEGRSSGALRIISVLLLSILLQLGLGSLWLAYFVGLEQCLQCGFYPFIFSEVARALALGSLLNIKNRFTHENSF